MTTKKELQKEKRERFLRSLIQEAIINVLAEQDLDLDVEPTNSSVPPANQTPAPETNVMDPSVQQASQLPAEDEPFTIDVMVEKLNTLRGGRSYTDPEIYGKLTTFFNNLTEEQRVSMEWYLNELSKIVMDIETSEPPNHNPQQQTQSTPPPQNNSDGPGSSSPPPQQVPPTPAPQAPVTPIA